MTIDEIKTEIGKSPDLLKQITSSFKDDFIKGMEAEGIIVRTKAQDQQFLDNHVKTVVDSKVAEQLQPKVDAEYSKMLGKIDDYVKSVTGIEKNTSEKTFDYAKRALDAIKAKGGDPVTKARVEELEKQIGDSKSSYEAKIAQLEKANFDTVINHSLSSDLDKRTFAVPGHVKTDEDKQKYITQEREMLSRDFLARFTPKKADDGSIVFYEGDKPRISAKDGKPLSAGDIISEIYASRFVPSQHVQNGTGAGQHAGGAGGFKTTADVHAHLAKQGLEAGTQEYMNTYTQLVTDNKL